MKKTNKAYVAGFIDADGSIIFQRTKRKKGGYHFYPRVWIYNSHKPVLKLIQSWYKGKLEMELQSPSKKMIKKLYRLRIKGKMLKQILIDIIPYLIIKKERAKICLEFLNHDKPVTRDIKGRIKPLSKEELKYRNSLWTQYKKMRKKGVSAYKNRTIKKW